MKAIQYFHDHDSEAAITLPKSVSSVGIELILKQCYYKSLLRKYPNVSFNFGQVTWCDVFAVSLFSLWIWELVQRGKKIKVFLPSSAETQRFFEAYDFRGFLNKQGVLLAGSHIDPSPPRSRELFVAPFYPLTFVTASAFQELIKDLQSGNRLDAVLAQVKAADVVKSGAIRDVILKELGDNMFLHARGTAAHFIMTKMQSLYPSRPLKWRRTTKRRLADVEASFIRKLGREPALEVVISDKGDGIFTTLKQAYENDAAIVKEPHPPTECEVIKYAFAYHSSRRTVEERVGLIKQVISSESFSIPPPTGLHRLKEIVRENHGLLYVRSGSSIICYDFYQNQEHDTPVRSDDLLDGKHLANFGGTQYRLLLPVRKPEDTKGRQYFASGFNEDLFAKTSEDLFAKTSVEHITLKDHFVIGAAGGLDEEAARLDTFFKDIDKKRATKKDQRLVLFADFSLAHRISAKVLHYLVCELIQRQEILQTNIVTYMPREVIADCRRLPVSFTRKLVAFDEAFTPHLIGATPSEDSAFQEILGSGNTLSDVASDFARSNGHLFHYSERNSRYFLSFPGSRTAQLTNTAIKQQLATDILEPTHDIFDPDIKVLLLSEAYCHGYFETYKILSNADMKEELIKSFSCSLIECQPDIVVSIGEQTREVMDATLRNNIFLRDQNIQHLNVQTGRSGHLRFANILGLDRTARVVVVTDVIGTSHTLESTLAIILHAHILKVLAIVNASTQWDKTIELKGQEIPVDYIVRKKLSYFDHLPRGWSYSEIHQVDPDTHVLVRTAASTESALWKGKEGVPVGPTSQKDADYPVNRFLADVVFPISAFSIGHFVSARKHILYLFDVHRIAERFSDEIIRTIEHGCRSHIDV